MTHTFSLMGDPRIAEIISCISYLLLLFVAYALVALWFKHYLARTAGGTIAARVIGVMLSVPTGNAATRIFVAYFPNFDDSKTSLLLVLFIGFCLCLCDRLVRVSTKPAAKQSAEALQPPTTTPGSTP